MIGNLLLANAVGFLFGALIVPGMLHILDIGNADNLLKGRGKLIVRNLLDAGYHFAKFYAAGSFYNDKIPGRGPIGAGIKKIEFSGVLKANAYYFNHGCISSVMCVSSPSTTACHVT